MPAVRIAAKDRVDQIRQALALVVSGNDKRERGWVRGNDGQG